MDPASFDVLDAYLMPARLAPYLRACGNDQAKARRLYVWNIEVSAAFWGPISGVEIAFRNALHAALTQHLGREDWWNDPAVPEADVEKARKTEKMLRRQRRRIKGAPPPTPDDVVAELSFGFWSGILHGPTRALEQHKYWHTCLHSAFPHWTYIPGARGREAFLRRVEKLRKFRNRVAHHEPVHGRNLVGDHDLIIEMAGRIHPDLARFIEGHSRVLHVLARRPAAVEHGDCQF